jgi:hypothetical protein
VSAELAARRTAAAAELAAFRRAADEFIDDATRAVPRPDYSMWAFLLGQHLGSLLQPLEAAEPELAAAKLEEIRTVLQVLDSETGDRQYALEQIDAIVNGDPK